MRSNSYLLLDSWNLSLSEVEGYSKALIAGDRQLEDLPKCPVCKRTVWAKSVASPLSIRFPGTRIGDVAFGMGSTLVVSERFALAWQRADLTGLLFARDYVRFRARKITVHEAGSEVYFATYPEPELVCLSTEAKAVWSVSPTCDGCCAGEVQALASAAFHSDGTLPDFMMPSCLPGWYAVSAAAAAFIRDGGFLNFRFAEGFRRGPDRRLALDLVLEA